jgi:hypothetical protein
LFVYICIVVGDSIIRGEGWDSLSEGRVGIQLSEGRVGIQLSEGRVGIHYQREGRVEIPLTGLTLPNFCACLKPGPLFPMSYFMVSFVFNCLRLEVIFCFVDHHCVNFFPP